MAGDWIKMRLDLSEDPAVMRMADKLGTREEHIVGYCHAFWSWVSRQCHDGSVTGVTLEALGRRISLSGFPEMLVEVGWLEYDDSGEIPVISIPHFERHLSQGSKQRALAAERQRNARVTKTSRTKRDKSVTREEKRREEKNIPPPPTPSENGTSPDGVVVELLKSAGVTNATKTATLAESAGWTFQAITQHLAYWQSRDDLGPGILVDRLTNADCRSLAPGDGWPGGKSGAARGAPKFARDPQTGAMLLQADYAPGGAAK